MRDPSDHTIKEKSWRSHAHAFNQSVEPHVISKRGIARCQARAVLDDVG